MLHITNGDSAASGIREASASGAVLSWIDVLHEGPVPENLSLDDLRPVRAEFIASCGWCSFEQASESFSRRDRILCDSLHHEEVILWFEHDLYDQLQVLQILDWFAQQNARRTKITLICAAEYLGLSTVARLRARYPERQAVSPAQLDLARAAWAAFRSPDPAHLTGLLQQDTSPLPFLAPALRRHLEQFPSMRNGLSRSENQALKAIESGIRTLGEAYQASHHGCEEAVFLGDTVFALYLERLSEQCHPLVLRQDGQSIKVPRGHADWTPFWQTPVTVTELGSAVLAGTADQVQLNGIDRWLGGVHLTGPTAKYRWDQNTIV